MTKMRSFRRFKSAVLLVTVFMSLSILTDNANAFDGHRKGFVAGIGLGWAPIAHTRSDYYQISRTQSGMSYLAIVGYGFSQRDVVAAELLGTFYEVRDVPDFRVDHEFVGLTWYHYYRRSNRSWFSKLGVGGFAFVTLDFRHQQSPGSLVNSYRYSTGLGAGATIGFGYQLSRLFQVGSNLTFGSNATSFDRRTSHYVWSLNLSTIIY